MAVGEALTNLASVVVEDLERVKCSANWMWAPKLPGEGAAIRDAVKAMREAMIEIGIGVDGGKDSLSMATMVGGETVKSPRELVISLYAAVPDITEQGDAGYQAAGLDPAVYRSGRSGSEPPGRLRPGPGVWTDWRDFRPTWMIRRCSEAVFWRFRSLIAQDLILAGHDRSDGGLITTLLEMAFAGNCGFRIDLDGETTRFSKASSPRNWAMWSNAQKTDVERIVCAAGR